jgi:hypothetical protein
VSLCADNGCETALLREPIDLPLSPYHVSNNISLVQSRAPERAPILHLF